MRSMSKNEIENRNNMDERNPTKTLMKKDLVNPDFYDVVFD